jgi:hypothetical protein
VAPQPPAQAALASLQNKVQGFESQKTELTDALARAEAQIGKLEKEREQAKRSAALYKNLVDLASAKEADPTNAYPTPRQAWMGLGRMGRIAALSKEDQSKLSAEEKAALEAARINTLNDLPVLLQSLKHFNESTPPGKDDQSDMDLIACLFYGALNLDADQFNQVYGVIQSLSLEAKHEGLSKDTPDAEASDAAKRLVEQFKAETQPFLSDEQNRILAQVMTQFQFEPGKWNYSASFGL